MPSGRPAPHVSVVPQAFLEAQNEFDTLAEQLGVPRDMFAMQLSQLPRNLADDIRTKLLDAMQYVQFWDKYGPKLDEHGNVADWRYFQQIRDYDEGMRGYGRFSLPVSEFVDPTTKTGTATVEKLAMQLQSWQVDNPAVEGMGRYIPGGPVVRAEQLEAAVGQWNEGFDLGRRHTMFDIETTGLRADADIWQISARLMEGKTELEATTMHFRPSEMFGSWGDDGQDFVKWLTGEIGDVEGGWHARSEFADGIRPLLEMVNKSEFVAAHNAPFDIARVRRAIEQTPQYKKPTTAADREFKSLADAFISKTSNPGNVVDTRMWAAMALGGIEVAPELRRLEKYTPLSMENIMLQTSFVSDVERMQQIQGIDVTDPQHIRNRIRLGTHQANVDTWLQEQFMQLADRKRRGEEVLSVESRLLERSDDLRKVITESSAFTPFTRMAHLGGSTPLLHGIETTRDFSSGLSTAAVMDHGTTQRQLFYSGRFSDWTDSILTKSGGDAGSIIKGMPIDAGFDAVRQRAIAAGIPFAGISAVERLVTTLMGEATLSGVGAYGEARQIAGDVSGSGLFQLADEARIYGSAKTNVALPMELIQQAETAGILQTQFGKALGDDVDALQDVRYSAFKWGGEAVKDAAGRITGRNPTHYDVALVTDPFRHEGDVTRFTKWLGELGPEDLKKYGLEENLDEVVRSIEQSGLRYGIQIGTMQGKGSPAARRLYNLLDHLQMGVDRSNPLVLRSFVFRGFNKGTIHTSAALGTDEGRRHKSTRISDRRRWYQPLMETEEFASQRDEVHQQVRNQKRLTESVLDMSDDPALRTAVRINRFMPSRNIQRVYEAVERSFEHLPRRLGIAGLGAAAYYMYRKSREQDIYDQTIEQQPYEQSPSSTGAQQTLPAIQTGTRGPNPLATAGTTQALHERRTQHTKMGASKYDYLF